MKKLLILSVALSLGATFAAAQATCTATTASVNGSYTYTATEFPFGTAVVTPPGTTTNQQPFSSTQVGTLIQALNGGGVFSSANVLYFDGAGHISIAASSASFMGTSVVGTYTVNGDCTISVTLTDVFNTTATSAGVPPTQATATLIGLVLGGGTELYLSVPQSATSTNGNMPLVPGEFATRLSIELIRTPTYGCSVASLTGSYGLIGSGFLAATSTGTAGLVPPVAVPSTMQPVSVFGVVTFDGAGNIIPQIVASGSPLGSFQYKGTYTVNLNCTGTMMLGPATSTTTTTTTTSATALTVNFVLTPPITYPTTSAYSASPGGNAFRPGIEFTLTSALETLSGFGIAQ
jgi:hypothetical protein